MRIGSFLRHDEMRRDAYKLLSACYYLPEQNTMGKLPELEEVLDRVCAEAAEHVAKMREETELEQLRVDYSRLFVGPFELLAPPYGSVYLERERKVMGDSTLDARNRYREAGLAFSGEVREAPDHIALELEFMYYLIFREIVSIKESDLTSAMGCLVKQKGFLAEHLGVWVAEFAERVEENASTGFYRNLATATNEFVQRDFEGISEVSIAGLSALTAAG